MSSYSNYHRLPAATTNQAFEPGPHLHAAAKQHWPRQVHLSIPRAKQEQVVEMDPKLILVLPKMGMFNGICLLSPKFT